MPTPLALFDASASFASVFLRSTAFFLVAELISIAVLVRARGWRWGTPATHLVVMAGPSLVHGTWATFVAGRQLLSSSGYELDAANTIDQRHILAVCLGYMLVDGAYCAIFLPSKDGLLFVLHHCVCGTYVLASHSLGHGAFSVMVCYFWGECTSPLHNLWVYARQSRTQRLYDLVMWVHPGLFLSVRFIIAPVVLGHACWFFLSGGSAVVPYPTGCMWSVFMVGIILGSVGHGIKLWKEWREWRRGDVVLASIKEKDL